MTTTTTFKIGDRVKANRLWAPACTVIAFRGDNILVTDRGEYLHVANAVRAEPEPEEDGAGRVRAW